MIMTPTGGTNAHHRTPRESRTRPLLIYSGDSVPMGTEPSRHQKASCAVSRATDTTLHRIYVPSQRWP